jgi:hypothetical protein
MLTATPEEEQAVIDYMHWQAPDLTVEFAQKVYTENVLGQSITSGTFTQTLIVGG